MGNENNFSKEKVALRIFIHKCPLCDLIFIKEFQEDYHTIVSGYDTKTGQYWPSGKYPANHMLKCIQNVDLMKAELEEDLEDIVENILSKARDVCNFSKLEPEIQFHTRKIILRYFTEAKEGAGL